MDTTVVTAHDPDIRSRRPDRGRFARTLLVLEVLLSVGAFGGAYYLIANAHDAMTPEALARLPFSTWVVPGLLLAACVAAPAAAVAYGCATGRPYAHPGHPLLGLALMGWIVVQVAVIGPVSWLQPAMFAWGLVLLTLGAANYRRWHTGWGATAEERAAAMAGDDLVFRPTFVATRAVTIDAPPEAAWPWIVQMSGRDADRANLRVYVSTPYRLIVWAKPDSTRAWRLRPTGTGGTRVVTRVRAGYHGGALLMEIGDFPMTRRSLRSVKSRAEHPSSRSLTVTGGVS